MNKVTWCKEDVYYRFIDMIDTQAVQKVTVRKILKESTLVVTPKGFQHKISNNTFLREFAPTEEGAVLLAISALTYELTRLQMTAKQKQHLLKEYDRFYFTLKDGKVTDNELLAAAAETSDVID